MLVIAHRGNINGCNHSMENKPSYIEKALQQGYDVEMDVWYNKEYNHLTLGHNLSQHVISKDFLLQEGIWCHAKNIDAVTYLLKENIKNVFYHERDSYTITSSGYTWTFCGEACSDKCIMMFPEKLKPELYENCYGVCTDYALQY